MADVKVKIFFSYSHKDEALRGELANYLVPLEREGLISTWHNREIGAGRVREDEIDEHLNSADIVLLLVSVNFIASDECGNEVQRAMERQSSGTARVIPIILKPIDWKQSPFGRLKALPEDEKPVTTWSNQDEAFSEIAREVRVIAKELQQQKEAEQAAQVRISYQSAMRARVPEEYYIERNEAKRLLQRFAGALKQPQGQPLLFNIYGIGGVGKTTLLGRLMEAYADTVDFLEICFAKTPDIRTPLMLMRRLHQQAVERLGTETSTDFFTQQEQQFETALFELSCRTVEGEPISSEEARKIRSWFERLIWLGPVGLTSTTSKVNSFESFGSGFSASTAVGEDAEGLQEWIQQRVRHHPVTRDNPELQALMLEPVSKLTQAFAESLIQIAQDREQSLVLILDTYEKAQPYFNQWLWQYLVEDTPLASSPVRLVVVGRRSLQEDEGWRKLNQDRKLIYEEQLKKFSRKDTDNYLQKIGIQHGGERSNIYKVTQGLPHYLNWVRDQRERGEKTNFVTGNQDTAQLLLQGISPQQEKILQVVACCRWFNLAIIRHLLESSSLGLQNADTAEDYFEWLKRSDFVEFTKGHYRLDDVVRDVLRQYYFPQNQTQFRKTNALLADYFKQQADEIVDPQSLLPDQYEDEEWRELMAESLYYSLFGKGKTGLQEYIKHLFAAVYLREPDIFTTPFAFISAEISEENQHLLPDATNKFFKNSGMALGFGWRFLDVEPASYKLKFEGENTPSEASEALSKQVETALQSLLGYVGNLKDGLGKCTGLMYRSLRCNRSTEKIELLSQAKRQAEQLLPDCYPKLAHDLFSILGRLFAKMKYYEDSLCCYKKALELEQCNASTSYGQGGVFFSLKRYEEALESLQKAIELDPEFAQAWTHRGGALCNLKRYEEALESLQKAIELDPTFAHTWTNQGNVLFNLKRYREAIASYQKAVELNPKSVEAWTNKGDALCNLKRYEEAIKSLQKAIELDPKSVNARKNQFLSLINLKRYEEALESLQKAIELDREGVHAWINQEAIISNLEQYEESLESLQEMAKLAPKSILAWIGLGDALFSFGRYEEAFESFQKAVELNPKSVDAWIGLGAVLCNLERYEEALESYDRAFELDPKNPETLNSQGLTLSFLKEFNKALAAIDQAINLHPQEPLYQANRGIVLARAGQYNEALADCEQAIKIAPEHESGHYGKACCYALQGDIEQAVNNLKKAIDIAPGHSRSEARQNPDFDQIQNDERFRALVYPEPQS